ncbi:hypothetical protein [Streptomyces sp. NPDC052042]
MKSTGKIGYYPAAREQFVIVILARVTADTWQRLALIARHR